MTTYLILLLASTLNIHLFSGLGVFLVACICELGGCFLLFFFSVFLALDVPPAALCEKNGLVHFASGCNTGAWFCLFSGAPWYIFFLAWSE